MNNKNILILNDTSEYYGNINYRLLLVYHNRDFMDNIVKLGIVDDELKQYYSFRVPNTVKEAIKCRDKISLMINYTSAYRDMMGTVKFVEGKSIHDYVYNYLIYGILKEDNINWSAKGTGYEKSMGSKRIRSIPLGTSEKYIDAFYKKHGNYFPMYDFKTNEEAKEYIGGM